MPIKISRSYFICYLKLVVLTEIVGPTPSTLLPCEITKVVCFNPDFLWDTCGTSEDYEGKRYTTVLKEEHNFHYHILHFLTMIRILLVVLFVRITVMNIYIYIYIFIVGWFHDNKNSHLLVLVRMEIIWFKLYKW